MPRVAALSWDLNRRAHKDALLKSLPIFSIACLGFLAIEAVLYAKAMPDTLALVSREEFWYLNTEWNSAMLTWMYYTLVVGFAVSSVGLTINFHRLKREHDFVRIELLAMWIFFLIGIVIAVA